MRDHHGPPHRPGGFLDGTRKLPLLNKLSEGFKAWEKRLAALERTAEDHQKGLDQIEDQLQET